MLHKIRKAMGDRDERYKLQWLIEMDETFIGASSEGNKKKGRGTEKTKVVIGVSLEEDTVYFTKMNIVDKVNKEEIKGILLKDVDENQTLKTDGWKAYSIADKLGHEHQVIKIDGSGKKAHQIFKWVHILAANLKAFIEGTLHGLDKKHLQAYLDEFCYPQLNWGLNRRFFENQLFDRLLYASITSKGITYADLRG